MAKTLKSKKEQGNEPDWQPLLDFLRDYIQEFMWMFEVELSDGTHVQAYKHRRTRCYFYLSGDSAFGWCGDKRYLKLNAFETFAEVVAPIQPPWRCPRCDDLDEWSNTEELH